MRTSLRCSLQKINKAQFKFIIRVKKGWGHSMLKICITWVSRIQISHLEEDRDMDRMNRHINNIHHQIRRVWDLKKVERDNTRQPLSFTDLAQFQIECRICQDIINLLKFHHPILLELVLFNFRKFFQEKVSIIILPIIHLYIKEECLQWVQHLQSIIQSIMEFNM